MAGVRSSKTVGSTTYKYDTLSGKVMRQSWGSNVIDFIYDENNQPFAMLYNGTTYYYVLNVQGDVIGLLNANGAIAAKYTYDPWGKVTVQSSNGTANTSSEFIGNINPLRYRGYYYDTDTGLYYLQSRYYDPTIGRFINADVYVTTNVTGLINSNMFAYCENNPVNMVDNSGTDAISLVVGGYISASSSLGCANIWNPIGWAVLGVTAIVAGIVLINNIIEVTAEETGQFQTYDPDPYKRPGQKKQGRENKEKKKRSGSWEGNKNKRQKPLPKHTPGREHRKYKTQKTKFVIVEIIHQIMVD